MNFLIPDKDTKKNKKAKKIKRLLEQVGFTSDDNHYVHIKDMLSEDEFENLINDFIKKELNYQESPIITNQDNFLKLFPDALIECDGILSIKPCELDEEYGLFATVCNCECDKCRKSYWLKEYEEISL